MLQHFEPTDTDLCCGDISHGGCSRCFSLHGASYGLVKSGDRGNVWFNSLLLSLMCAFGVTRVIRRRPVRGT